MSFTQNQIINMALGHLNAQMTVVDFSTDQSEQAKTASTYYNMAVGKMLDNFPWPFAAVFAPLAEITFPFSRERAYAYAYPPNCRLIRRLFNQFGYNRNDDVQSRQKFKIIQTPNPTNGNQLVKVILADHTNLQVEYTMDIIDPSLFPDSFADALSWLLAYYMAPRLTGGDPYKLGDRAAANFKTTYETACMLLGNEEVQDEPRLGEFIDQRQGPLERNANGMTNWTALPSGFTIGG